jgi:NAD+ kinase
VQKIAIMLNPEKTGAVVIRDHVQQLFQAAGIETVLFDVGLHFDATQHLEELQGVEIAVVLGGDGTLLGVARQIAPLDIPLFGINAGHLGFLTDAEPHHVDEAVQRMISGDFQLEERLMLEATVFRDGDCIASWIGLNDAGIAKGSFARMVTLEVSVDGAEVDTYRGDGVLVSTPTGSTAYSLSCGGPVIVPHVKVMVVTPICPHTLVSRPFVINCDQEVSLTVHASHQDIGLTVDGQVGTKLLSGDVVRVRKSAYHTTLVSCRQRDFFKVLRSKLHGPQVTL